MTTERHREGPQAVNVLALDLSLTATGVAMPNGTLDTLRPRGKGDHRLQEIRSHITEILNDLVTARTAPSLVAIEGPVTRSQAATIIGMVHGAVRTMLIAYEVPYLVVPPAVLKKYATGKGNAPKPDMRMALYKRTGQDVPDDNQVDAAWLRLLALDLLGTSELDMPAAHRAVLDKLTVPQGAS